MAFRFGAAAFILVFGIYLFLGGMGLTDRGNPSARDAPYNLLARGLLSGHLYVDREAPALLGRLANPYDPLANRDARDVRDRLNDFSYYKGRLFLYFGVAPALFVFVPWHLLTGGWMPHWVAVVALCSGGLLVNLALVLSVRRREFPGTGPWLAGTCGLLLGLASYAPLLVARADMWEVPLAFGYAAVSVTLFGLWKALDAPERAARWMALASAALGLGFAARPTLLLSAPILVVPMALPALRRSVGVWTAAGAPFALCGVGVALYNLGRFGSPFDFGIHYQLSGFDLPKIRAYSPSYFWTGVHFYLFQLVDAVRYFPFVAEPSLASVGGLLPPGHGGMQQMSGALVYAPVLWAALALPACLRGGPGRPRLALLAAAVAWAAAVPLAFLCCYFSTVGRYQFEFVPDLALLASLGLLALEGGWGRSVRVAARWLWVPALLVSSTFPVLYGISRIVSDHNTSGLISLSYRDFAGAEHDFAIARSLSPANPGSRLGEGAVLLYQGRPREAQAALESLVHDFPGQALARYFLGAAYSVEGRTADARTQYEAAHRLDPDNPGIARALASPAAPAR
jgi:tetratricopeptide (TPR) repeat protein